MTKQYVASGREINHGRELLWRTPGPVNRPWNAPLDEAGGQATLERAGLKEDKPEIPCHSTAIPSEEGQGAFITLVQLIVACSRSVDARQSTRFGDFFDAVGLKFVWSWNNL